MPILTFQCYSCGLKTKQRVSAGTSSVSCSNCQQQAVTEATTSTMSYQAPVNSVGLQNTGVEASDLDFDRVIAEDARKKWEQIYERRQAKWDIVDSNEGSKGSDLVRLPNGEYLLNRNISSELSTRRETTRDIMEKQRTSLK